MEFLTLEQANDYFQNERPESEEWFVETMTDEIRSRYLSCAENIIAFSAFRFPPGFLDAKDRSGRPYRILRNAICEEAIHLMQTGALRKNPKLMMGIQQASVGPLSVTFSKEFDKPLIPPELYPMLESIGAISAGTSTIQSGSVLF